MGCDYLVFTGLAGQECHDINPNKEFTIDIDRVLSNLSEQDADDRWRKKSRRQDTGSCCPNGTDKRELDKCYKSNW